MSLKYRIVYEPSANNAEYKDNKVKYTCSDGNIHIRLRDYDSPRVIAGFIEKLTYVITYLVRKRAMYDALTTDDFVSNDFNTVWTNVIGYLEELKEYKSMVDFIKLYWPKDSQIFNKIIITKNYRKVKYEDSLSQFGSLSGNCCPVTSSDRGNLIMLEETIGTYIVPFLFDDGYSIEIVDTTKSDRRLNKKMAKYVNKAKVKEVQIKNDDYVDLWSTCE